MKLISFLKKWPLSVLLLPVYFILDKYFQFAGLLHLKELFLAFSYVLLGILMLFAVTYLVFKKDRIKAGIAAVTLGSIYLYFGNFKVFLGQIPFLSFLYHYRILLPLVFLLVVFFMYYLWRKPNFLKLNTYINILLLANIGLVLLFGKPMNKFEHAVSLVNKKVVVKPDIWYLLFDCYPSSGYQRERLGVSTNIIDSALRSRGFFVAKNSSSNYNYTPFSMASGFAMDYLVDIKENEKALPFQYNQAMQQVKDAPMFEFLRQHGYQLHNISIFDIDGKPALKKENFLAANIAHIIFYYTLGHSIHRDILPHLFPAMKDNILSRQQKQSKVLRQSYRDYNALVTDSVFQLSKSLAGIHHDFVYAHLMMPHFPYFFDSAGRAYPDSLVFGQRMITNREMFRNYISYTNNIMIRLIDSIQLKSKQQSLIIVQSDHGINNIAGNARNDAFRNYTAIFTPGKVYNGFYDNISNINTFRVIFNKYFGQELPLLPDSSIYVR